MMTLSAGVFSQLARVQGSGLRAISHCQARRRVIKDQTTAKHAEPQRTVLELVPVRRSSCQRCQRRPASLTQRVSTNNQQPTKKKKERTHANGTQPIGETNRLLRHFPACTLTQVGLLRGDQVPASNCSKSKTRRLTISTRTTRRTLAAFTAHLAGSGLGWAGLAGDGSWQAGLKPDSAASNVVVIRIDPVWSEHRRPPFSGHLGLAPLRPSRITILFVLQGTSTSLPTLPEVLRPCDGFPVRQSTIDICLWLSTYLGKVHTRQHPTTYLLLGTLGERPDLWPDIAVSFFRQLQPFHYFV